MSEKFEKMLQEALKKYYVDVDIYVENLTVEEKKYLKIFELSTFIFYNIYEL